MTNRLILADHNALRAYPDQSQIAHPPYGNPAVNEMEITNFYFDLLVFQRGLDGAEALAFVNEVARSGKPPESYLDPKIPLAPLAQAQKLIHLAIRSNGRQRQKLARRALAICADCADAYVLLAEAEEPADALPLLREGMTVGERLLKNEFGAEKIEAILQAAESPARLDNPALVSEDEIREREKENGFCWWVDQVSRPYLRCRSLLAYHLSDLGEVEDAAAHRRALLRICPRDNPGNRVPLAGWLCVQSKDDPAAKEELGVLLLRYNMDDTAPMFYCRALLLLREGQKKMADEMLQHAFSRNTAVATTICGLTKLTFPKKTMRRGSHEEASEFLLYAMEAWREKTVAEWVMEQFGSVLKQFASSIQTQLADDGLEPQ